MIVSPLLIFLILVLAVSLTRAIRTWSDEDLVDDEWIEED